MQIPSPSVVRRVATELGLPPKGVDAALTLFGEGATLPFIARYRKEITGGLDEIQLREVRDRAAYLTELDERRTFILASVDGQGALTPELAERIRGAGTKQALEDLYLPFRPKRRTRAILARERGLEPLADAIWEGRVDDAGAWKAAREWIEGLQGAASGERSRDVGSGGIPAAETLSAVPDPDSALQGARDILAERVSEDAGIRGHVRDACRKRGRLYARVLRGRKDLPEAQRFRDYFEHAEPMRRVQPHRILAIRRGESEGFLAWGVEAPEEIPEWVERRVVSRRPARGQLAEVAADAWKRLLHPALESDIKAELKEEADEEAIRIFGTNLEKVLLQPPAGERPVLGLDPGFRTGVKAAMVSGTGAVLDTGVLPLHQEERFRRGVLALVTRYRPELIGVGNGTASRETEQAVRAALESTSGSAATGAGREGGSPGDGALPPTLPSVVSVNEAGASVYSASELAGAELPDLDVSLRGAVSIARRLQDPLAELVKIDAKSIGVGQYQHDVNQARLAKRLDEVVEGCVNRVGVEVNTASPALLSYVAGIGPTLAANIARLRDERGGFRSRKELLDVPKLGPKAFEQAAGFLRIRGGAHPLEATAVHPERYPLVERIAEDLGTDVAGLVENEALLGRLEESLDRYTTEAAGRPTLEDILSELRRPGRDPRETFEAPVFREDIRAPEDLKPDMVLQGVVTTVVAFGAFVDIGAGRDGMIHVTEMGRGYVGSPAEILSVGDEVQVRVLEVDPRRGRISLSMKDLP
ncbi:MAG: Tex family protein, partial [Longimicrobiales bacterium]